MSQIKRTQFRFPDPTLTSEDGLLCVGGDLEVETLFEAYSRGIFPWPQEGFPLLWFCPPQRGVLEFKDFHVSKSLQKQIKKKDYEFKMNNDFDQVIEACASQPRVGQEGTWILGEMVEAYKKFHRAGFCHSFEIWQRGVLVGGLYGVEVNGVFSGESMFFRKDNMSKIALVETVKYLLSRGCEWIDVQMVTPQIQRFGGKYIDREEFLKRLKV